MTSDGSRSFVQAVYFDATTTIRHYDTARTQFAQMFTAILVLITSATTASLSYGIGLWTTSAAAALAAVLTVVGTLVVLKFNGLIRLQKARATAAMTLYEDLARDISLSSINKEAKLQTDDVPSAKFSLGALFVAIFLIIGGANVTLLLIALCVQRGQA